MMKSLICLLSIFMMSCSTHKLIHLNTDQFETLRSIDTVYSYLGGGSVVPQIQLGLISLKVRVETFEYDPQSQNLRLSGIIQDGQTREAVQEADIFIGSVNMKDDAGIIVNTLSTHSDTNGRFSIQTHISAFDHLYVGALGYLVASYELDRWINERDR